MRFICSGWGRARSATGWFSSVSLGHTMNLFKWFMGKRKRYKLVDAADHIGYEWTGRAHGSLADALATLAVQRWLEQWLVAE